MNKEDFIQPTVENALNNIDFVKRYELLSKTYATREESFLYKNDEILEIANDLGYGLKYSKSKEFYFTESNNNYKFGFGFTLRYYSLELGCSAKNKALHINSSAPWGFWVNLIDNNQRKLQKPMFSNYEDLKEILKEAFSIYEDFKQELLKRENI